MIQMTAQSKGSGLVINWKKFKDNQIVPAKKWDLLTVKLTDVITDLLEALKSFDPHYSMKTVSPNGFTSPNFDIEITGKGFKVECGRRLVRGGFPLIPIAAEIPSNYDAVIKIDSQDSEIIKVVVDRIQKNYMCKVENI